MNFVDEISSAINLGLEEFKTYINKKMKQNKDFLEQLFWLPNGSQMTVLNYLIEEHKEYDEEADETSIKDLRELIDYVLTLSNDLNVGEPLHQAIATGKIRLALHLLKAEHIQIAMQKQDYSKATILDLFNLMVQKAKDIAKTIRMHLFDMNQRDAEGRTLISLALAKKNPDLLCHLLLQSPNVHAPTCMTSAKVPFQPLHQAIVLDFADGVRLLAFKNADLSNPLGLMKDSPVSLAARLGKIYALEALLEQPLNKLALEAENMHLFADQITGYTAIDELCERIANNDERSSALRGVAMLLCRGAEPPRNEDFRSLLSNHRIDLLKAVHEYLEHKPELVDSFVARCHLKEGALHNIVFSNHSWGNSIRHLFGKPCDTAFMVEDLVVRKYYNPKEGSTLLTRPAEQFSQENDPLKLYAAFVRLYNQAYDNQLFPNCWSTMRWMIADGRCDWATVLRYSENHPTSRTRIIINEMFQQVPEVHNDEDLSQEPECPVSP
jgi:ankyrin repeat protein